MTPAEIQHNDAIADVPDHREIMRDEQVCQPEPFLQLHHQVDDLRLDVDVQRRDRLVGDDKLRSHRQRPGDRDALPLAAREFVRETADTLGGKADQIEQLHGTPAR